jgi:hypothetical protein
MRNVLKVIISNAKFGNRAIYEELRCMPLTEMVSSNSTKEWTHVAFQILMAARMNTTIFLECCNEQDC